MKTELTAHDALLTSTDWLSARSLPVAIELKEPLEPAAGPDAVVFPPTYARDKDNPIGHPYAIDVLVPGVPVDQAEREGRIATLCCLDAVGSQANRMEPIFAETPLSALVPQITFTISGEQTNLLHLGHRLADGVMRFSGLSDNAATAIRACDTQRDAEPIARMAPTSLVFGLWDSRETQLKLPRIVAATISATNVDPLKRSAQFVGNKPVREVIEQAREAGELNAERPALSTEGLLDAPSVDTHGGVRVHGSITRRTEINLIYLRALQAAPAGQPDATRTLKLRRYIFALALVAATAQSSYNLRQGCLLVRKTAAPITCQLISPDGTRSDFSFTFDEAYAYAQAAAQDYGVGENQQGDFEVTRVAARLEANSKKDDKKADQKAKKKTTK